MAPTLAPRHEAGMASSWGRVLRCVPAGLRHGGGLRRSVLNFEISNA
jgi:hypothetical protein